MERSWLLSYHRGRIKYIFLIQYHKVPWGSYIQAEHWNPEPIAPSQGNTIGGDCFSYVAEMNAGRGTPHGVWHCDGKGGDLPVFLTSVSGEAGGWAGVAWAGVSSVLTDDSVDLVAPCWVLVSAKPSVVVSAASPPSTSSSTLQHKNLTVMHLPLLLTKASLPVTPATHKHLSLYKQHVYTYTSSTVTLLL